MRLNRGELCTIFFEGTMHELTNDASIKCTRNILWKMVQSHGDLRFRMLKEILILFKCQCHGTSQNKGEDAVSLRSW